MTVVSCSIDERYVNPLFEVFDGGDFVLTSYRDVEDTLTTMQLFLQSEEDAPHAVELLAAAGRIVGVELSASISRRRLSPRALWCVHHGNRSLPLRDRRS